MHEVNDIYVSTNIKKANSYSYCRQGGLYTSLKKIVRGVNSCVNSHLYEKEPNRIQSGYHCLVVFFN